MSILAFEPIFLSCPVELKPNLDPGMTVQYNAH